MIHILRVQEDLYIYVVRVRGHTVIDARCVLVFYLYTKFFSSLYGRLGITINALLDIVIDRLERSLVHSVALFLLHDFPVPKIRDCNCSKN